jgi:hypothetical protein
MSMPRSFSSVTASSNSPASARDWTTNCRDIQDQFDIIHNTRDGIQRKYGRNGSDILEYLHQIGKRMRCEDFQW